MRWETEGCRDEAWDEAFERKSRTATKGMLREDVNHDARGETCTRWPQDGNSNDRIIGETIQPEEYIVGSSR